MTNDLHKRQHHTNERSQCSTRKLAERGYYHHAYVSPAQRHIIHIDTLAVGIFTHMQQSTAKLVPALDSPAEYQSYANAHGRLEES